MPCRVVIADDVEAIRSLWRLFLTEDPQIVVVGEAADGLDAIAQVERHRPDVLVLDLAMPRRDGLEVIPVARTVSPETAIIVASGFSGARMGRAALDLGAVGYFEKGESPHRLAELVLAACRADEPVSDGGLGDAR